MNRLDIERLLRDHLRGVHEELETLFRGVERALANHLTETERALAELLDAEREDTETRVAALEKRIAALEARQ